MSKYTLPNPIECHAWPGGYPIYYVCKDGGVICPNCVKRNLELIMEATCNNENTGWEVVANDINWEDNNLICDHCGNRIEPAYCEDQND